MDPVVIEPATTPAAQVEAASIWARATDVRDSCTVPSDPAAKLEGIQERLRSPCATLHMARRGDAAQGFALLVPHGSELELVYLAVDPAAWGRQTASALLAHVASYARECQFDSVDLWVLADNERAIETYARAGWQLTAQEKCEGNRRELQMMRPFARWG
ncbi:GNAT family N-acetyltransferase [Aeromicrobium sp. CF3.5]|uniref:GNAT family N-acetyltransferase n=1 Tax=Aeromicrobium sp. CF3.5 TaxID=3373078 RepID=UPI003EE771C2